MDGIPGIVIRFDGGPEPYPGALNYRTCVGDLCLQCPTDRNLFGDDYINLQRGYPILACISIVLMLVLLTIFVWLPKNRTSRNVFTCGYACANIIFSMAFLFSINEAQRKKTGCYDDLIRATGLRVPRCAASGMLFVFGCLATRYWAALWITELHFNIVWERSFFKQRSWIPVAVATIVPLTLACSALPFYEYNTGGMCMPRLGTPILLLLEIPLAFSDGTAAILQLWTFGKIFTVLLQKKENSSMHSESSQSTRSKHILGSFSIPLNQCLISALKMLARPIIFTTLSLLCTVFIASSFFTTPAPENRIGGFSDAWQPSIETWLACVMADPSKVQTCALANTTEFNYHRLVVAWYYCLIMSIGFFFLCMRMETVRAIREGISSHFKNSKVDRTPSPDAPESSSSVMIMKQTDGSESNILSVKTEYVSQADVMSDRPDSVLSNGGSKCISSITSPMSPRPGSRPVFDHVNSELNAYLVAGTTPRQGPQTETESESPTSPKSSGRNSNEISQYLPWDSPATSHRPAYGTVGCPRSRYSFDSDVRPYHDF